MSPCVFAAWTHAGLRVIAKRRSSGGLGRLKNKLQITRCHHGNGVSE